MKINGLLAIMIDYYRSIAIDYNPEIKYIRPCLSLLPYNSEDAVHMETRKYSVGHG